MIDNNIFSYLMIKMYGYSYICRILKCSDEWQRYWSRYSMFSKYPVWPNAIPVFQKIEKKKGYGEIKHTSAMQARLQTQIYSH